MVNFESIKQTAASAVHAAAKTGAQMYEKGRRQMDRMALETKLARAQRQLGALVYSLHQSKEESPEQVQKYVDAIAAVERQLVAYETSTVQNPEAAVTHETVLCPGCGTEVAKDAVFCAGCGEKLL